LFGNDFIQQSLQYLLLFIHSLTNQNIYVEQKKRYIIHNWQKREASTKSAFDISITLSPQFHRTIQSNDKTHNESNQK
jgi:hypothetical protein